jgi:hypothetical protein
MDKPTFSQKDYENFENQFIDLQNARFRQNAEVISLMIHFQEEDILKRLFRDYVSKSGDYLRDFKLLVRVRYCILNPRECIQENANEEQLNNLRTNIDNYVILLNESYSEITLKIKEEIGRVEDESESFRL